MSQIVNGTLLGSPGPVGSAGIYDLYGAGAPSASTDPNVAAAANGSTYRNTSGGTGSTLYVKVTGIWMAIA